MSAGSGGRDEALKVGLFLIVSLVATLGVLFVMTDAALFRGRYVVTTTVPDAGGIRRGDPVQMRGVNVGRVLGFSISAQGVQIRLEIEGEYPIAEDSKVFLKSAGLLGGMVADIQPGNAERKVRYGDTLPGTSEEAMMSATQRLMDDAGGAISRFETMLSEDFVKDVHATGKAVPPLLTELQSTVVEQRKELRALAASMRRNSEGLEKITTGDDLKKAVQRFDEVAARADRLADSLEVSSQSLQSVMKRVEQGEGTLGKLSKDDTLYAEMTGAARSMREATESMNKLLADVQKNPKRYLKFSVF